MALGAVGLAGSVEEDSGGYADIAGGSALADQTGWLATEASSADAESSVRALLETRTAVKQSSLGTREAFRG